MFPDFDELRHTLLAIAEPERIPAMEAYMRDQFEFLGVTTAERKPATKAWTRAAKRAEPDDLLAFVDECWAQPEREFQYQGTEALRAGALNLRADDLDRVRGYVTTKSWWDTVDALAARTVGPMVQNHNLGAVMDDWIDDDNMWVARTAILHQLMYKEDTDAERLFHYVDRQADHKDFFIRKALGWALRQYSRIDPDEVWAIVEEYDDRLSGLTKREALKHLNSR